MTYPIDEVTDVSDVEIGQRIRALRERRGFSREQLAARAGISPSSVKSIETGLRALTLRAAKRLAPHLGVTDLGAFYGEDVHIQLESRPSHPAVPALRKALTSWGIAVTGRPESGDYLRALVDTAWQTWHTSEHQRTEVGRILPGLLDAARRSARLTEVGAERNRVLAMEAQAYHLAQAFLAHHGERELVYLTVDRGLSSALDSGDPLAIANSVWYAAHVLRAVGRSEEALSNLDEARVLVEREIPAETGEERVVALADLWRCSAITKARMADQGAWNDMQQARDLVQSLPEGYVHPWTRCGRVLVDVEAVMLAVDLGDAERARELAQDIDPDTIPSTDRQARHLVEVARALQMEGSPEAVLHVLTQAARVSPETVAYTPAGREMAHRLVRTSGASSRRDAETLAAHIGLEI